MLPSRRLLTVAAAALAVGVSACADDDRRAEPRPTRPPVGTDRAQPAPPPLPSAEIRIVDGDSGKPVARASVAGPSETWQASRDGVAELGPLRRRVTIRISARGYEPRTVHPNFRKRLVHEVPIWRPALQWPMYGANPGRTQAHGAIKLRPPFRVVWKRRLHGLLEFPAVVWNGVAYVNNIHGFLSALSMKNGRVLWRKRLGTLNASSPAVDPERGVLVTTSMSPGYVNVVSMKTGRVQWRFYSGRAEPSPVIRRGVAYFAATSGNVYALDLDRRRPRWVFQGGAKITSSPALVGKRLYVGDYAGRVFALDARTGRLIWRGSAGSKVYGTMAVAGGRVFAPSVGSGLSALSARSGRLLWRIPVSGYLYSSPAVFRDRVYFGTYGGRVYSASASSGRILWSQAAGGRVSGAVQVVAGVVYAATLEGRTTAWSWRGGRTLWRLPLGEYVPVSGNGTRLLMHGYNRIWAVEPKRRRR